MRSRVSTFLRSVIVAGSAFAVATSLGCREIEETENPVSNSLAEIGATAPAGQSSTSAELSRLQFDDVPVPEGFFLRNQRNESYSYRFGRARIGRLVYWGRGDEEDLRARFLELMPKDRYNWRLVGDSNGELAFEKTGHRCRIGFARERLGGDDILITIFVESI